MTSRAKIEANRRNAARSKGPLTREGKAKSSRNAFVHGLSVAVKHTGPVAAEIEELAKLFGAHSGAPREIAMGAAQARIELLRVRRAKDEIINSYCRKTAKDVGSDLSGQAQIGRAVAANLPQLVVMQYYELRALSRFNTELRRLETQQNVAFTGPSSVPVDSLGLAENGVDQTNADLSNSEAATRPSTVVNLNGARPDQLEQPEAQQTENSLPSGLSAMSQHAAVPASDGGSDTAPPVPPRDQANTPDQQEPNRETVDRYFVQLNEYRKILHSMSKSEGSYDLALALRYSRLAETIREVGIRLLCLREFEEALGVADRLVAIVPTNPKFNILRAHALMFLERPEEARALYERFHNRNAHMDELGIDVIRREFTRMRDEGLTHPLMEAMETHERSVS